MIWDPCLARAVAAELGRRLEGARARAVAFHREARLAVVNFRDATLEVDLGPGRGVVVVGPPSEPDADAEPLPAVSGRVEAVRDERVIVMRITLPFVQPTRDPAPLGNWRVEIEATGSRTDDAEVRYTVIVNSRSRIRLETVVSQTGHRSGSAATLTARVVGDHLPAPVDNVHVALTATPAPGASITTPSGTSTTSPSVTDTGNGFFKSEELKLGGPGAYSFVVTATGTVDGNKFRRERTVTAAIWDAAQDPGDPAPVT